MKFLTKHELKKQEDEKKRKSQPSSKESPSKKKKTQKTKKLSSEFVNDEDEGTVSKARGWSAITFFLSPQLSSLLGLSKDTQLARTDVVKKIWEHIKSNDLQDPNDKRQILCDELMQKVFGKKVHMFTMNKLLGHHLSKDESITKMIFNMRSILKDYHTDEDLDSSFQSGNGAIKRESRTDIKMEKEVGNILKREV